MLRYLELGKFAKFIGQVLLVLTLVASLGGVFSQTASAQSTHATGCSYVNYYGTQYNSTLGISVTVWEYTCGPQWHTQVTNISGHTLSEIYAEIDAGNGTESSTGFNVPNGHYINTAPLSGALQQGCGGHSSPEFCI